MALDYVSLRNDLGATLKMLSPPSVQMTQQDFYTYFRKKLAVLDDQRHQREQAVKRDVSLGVASLMSLAGVAVAGAAFAPVAAGMVGAAGSYVAARVIVSAVRDRQDADERYRARALLGASIDVQRREFERDAKGGFFKRLYDDVRDRLSRYGARTEKLIERIDRLGVAGPHGYAVAVKRELGSLSPAFDDYLQRTALDKSSSAAHLLARIKTIAELAPQAQAPQPDRSGGQPGQARAALDSLRLGSFSRGLAGSGMPAASREVSLPTTTPGDAEPKAPSTYYGFIRAREDEGDFIRSFGVELGPYDSRSGGFNAKASQDAYDRIVPLAHAIGTIEMHGLESSVKDVGFVTARPPLDTLSASQLSAYGMYLAFETATAPPPGDAIERARLATLATASEAVRGDWRRRETVEAGQAVTARVPAASEGLEI